MALNSLSSKTAFSVIYRPIAFFFIASIRRKNNLKSSGEYFKWFLMAVGGNADGLHFLVTKSREEATEHNLKLCCIKM